MKPTPATASVLTVGIGASAGGLEALEKFLAKVPANSGLAFVVIPHLDPTVEDMMSDLLQRFTHLEVHQVRDRVKVAANHVYVIPPNKDLSIRAGVLHLSVPTAVRGLRLPIDFFLRTLARDQGERAIGVILSGMGSDGCMGLRAIKEVAGLCLAQCPTDARFPSMPSAAIDAGLVDMVADAEELPGKILGFLNSTQRLSHIVTPFQPPERDALEMVTRMLRLRTGQEFSLYKRNTLVRRVERRMAVHQITHIDGYARYLEANPNEVDLLFKELLIGVTSFFRDPAMWMALEELLVSRLTSQRPEGKNFRAWVPGCSTGEEAYSLAIVFMEALEQVKPKFDCNLQIFATDLDRDAIEKARQGYFKANIAADVSEARLGRFFVPDQGGHRIRKDIREMVVFAPQNLIMDPPFTKLDILSCRNLLIYLAPELQKKLMLLFHYSLAPGGILFLGSSESVGLASDRFQSLDAKARLFQRNESILALQTLVFPPSIAATRQSILKEEKMADPGNNLASLAEQMLLQEFSPPAVLVTEAGDILYVNGRTGKFLEPAAGKANWNVLAMAREELRTDLAGALHRAAHQDAPVLTRDLKLGVDRQTVQVNMTVRRLTNPSPLNGLIMVVFHEKPPAPAPRRRKGSPGPSEQRIIEMEQALLVAREEQRSLQQEMQTSQEELKSTNEELQSTNEELQSTNEELTTSKEELQSLNEELQTINAGQHARMEELARTTSDIKNLLDATNIATIFLDSELKVGRFTPSAQKLYNLLPGDVGRPLTDITSNMLYPELPEDARDVLRHHQAMEKTVATLDGHWYLVRIGPYRAADDELDGLVLTFADATLVKQKEAEYLELDRQFQDLLARLPFGYLACQPVADGDGRSADGRLLRMNDILLKHLGLEAEPAAGGSVLELLPGLAPLWAGLAEEDSVPGAALAFDRHLDTGKGRLGLAVYRSRPDRLVLVFAQGDGSGAPDGKSRSKVPHGDAKQAP